MSIDAITLRTFLERANSPIAQVLPWVHSTQSANLLKILAANRILATPCNVFAGENLCYLFCGRPAYKYRVDSEPSYWQLPLVFLFRFASPPPLARVFPFDSGAFSRKLLPDYITMFDIRDFDIGGNQDSIGRLISIFFKDPEHYWRRNVISQADFSKEHNLGPRFQEIVALQRLFAEYSSPKFDDRSATIEAQIPADILINQGDLLGVVLPKEYLRDEEIHNALKSITKQILSYDIYPIALDQYYGSIYEKVQQIYKNCRIIE